MTRPLLQCSLSVQDMYKRYTTCFCRPPQRILSTKNATSSFHLEWNGVFVLKCSWISYLSWKANERPNSLICFGIFQGSRPTGSTEKVGIFLQLVGRWRPKGGWDKTKKEKVGFTKKKKSGWNKISTFLQIGFDRFKKKSRLFRGSNLPLVWKAGKTLGTSGKSKIVNHHFIYLFIQTILLACLNHKFIWEKVVWLAGGGHGRAEAAVFLPSQSGRIH